MRRLRPDGDVYWKRSCVAACPQTEPKILLKQFENKVNTISTSSFGRLFDAVASIAGVRQSITYEAQGAIKFEALLDNNVSDSYEFKIIEGDIVEIDCAPLIRRAALDVLDNVSIGEISAKFHNGAANLILQLALLFRHRENLNTVVLSGGCFQNIALLQASLKRLREENEGKLAKRSEDSIFVSGLLPRPIVGRQQREAMQSKMQEVSKRRPNQTQKNEMKRLVVAQSGDVAYDFGDFTVSFDAPVKTRTSFNGSYLNFSQ